jgi:hypothetical protein
MMQAAGPSSAAAAALPPALWRAARDGDAAEVQRHVDDVTRTGAGDVDAVGRAPGDGPSDHHHHYPSTPLAIACRRQHPTCASILMRAGANAWSTATGSAAPSSIMHDAIASHHHEVIRLLVREGVDASMALTDSRRSLQDMLDSRNPDEHATALVLLDVGVEACTQSYLRAV